MTVDITTDPPAQLTAPRATTGTLGELDVDMVAALVGSVDEDFADDYLNGW